MSHSPTVPSLLRLAAFLALGSLCVACHTPHAVAGCDVTAEREVTLAELRDEDLGTGATFGDHFDMIPGVHTITVRRVDDGGEVDVRISFDIAESGTAYTYGPSDACEEFEELEYAIGIDMGLASTDESVSSRAEAFLSKDALYEQVIQFSDAQAQIVADALGLPPVDGSIGMAAGISYANIQQADDPTFSGNGMLFRRPDSRDDAIEVLAEFEWS